MKYEPLSREEMIRVIEGRGCADRIPQMYHFWINPGVFEGEDRTRVEKLMRDYPMDIQNMYIQTPSTYDAPADDPSYRWSYKDKDVSHLAADNSGCIEDWDEEIDDFLNDFPSAEYPGLFPQKPAPDGRYRLCEMWGFFYERYWGIRSMENALTDFYLNPEAVHRVFQKYADFYKRVLVRAKEELNPDGVFTSDDLGHQKSTFFSPQIFDEFFAPYYKQVVDQAHKLGMHFWLHTCGNVEAFVPKYIDLGINVLHPIQKFAMNQEQVARKYGSGITVWAGFDVQQAIPYGTPEDVRAELRRMMDNYYREDGRFMLTMGNGVTADTPAASLEALFEETMAYNPCRK